MLNALMLVFVLTVSGEAATIGVRFQSVDACEARRSLVMAQVSQDPCAEYVAVVCVVPAKVQPA